MSAALLHHQNRMHAMTELYGGNRQRSLSELLREIDTGAAALSSTVSGWQTFLPKPAGMDEAERCLEGLLRLVRELRSTVNTQAPDNHAGGRL